MIRKEIVKKAVSQTTFWAVLSVILVSAFLVTVTYEATKASVQVTQNGEKELIRTHADTVEELMSDLDVAVQPHDELSHKLSDSVEYGMDVEYIASKSVHLAIDGGEKEDYSTTAATVGEFFKENDLEFKEHDQLSHQSSEHLADGMSIEVAEAFQVTLNDGGDEEHIWTTTSTVEELLKEQGIELDDLDELNLDADAWVSADTPLEITRVEKVTDIVEEETDYSVEVKKDDSLPKGERKVLEAGQEGLVKKTYEVTIENGEEVSRELVEETVDQESRREIVALGTKVDEPAPQPVVAASTSDAEKDTDSSRKVVQTSANVSKSSQETSREKESSQTMRMHATAYTAECAGCSGVTATGIDLNENPDKKVVAVDPSVIPLGSRVWVEGYGYAVAGDTGGAINGKRIDLHVSSKSEAYNFGSKTVQVKILDE
ncbi:G5 and 3D domain-containing protein [Halobacillus kuroshimensis]|uniref:G5 and 3D domain-containing protein n=1 Tax=Halobacillus kuroshimensis TaxID=302481 RepID=UPI0003FB66E5|nr:G5 and 3D domain-containing protein [Halobacillus kuroshimensis]